MGTRIPGTYNKGNDLRFQQSETKALCETFESQEYFHRAEICVQKRNFGKAEGLLAEALKIVPENALYLSYYGLCRGMLGEIREAERLCTKALKLAPTSPIVNVNLGRIRLAQGNRKEARDCFSRAYELDNTNSAAALELSGMGVRRPPVISFLPRNNPLNIFLGKIRHRILGYKKVGLKKY